ncbi:hypothetical protein ACHAWU_000584 [Discostella pseudostelligera]|uniref:Nitroreductase domain-containing protein n=1 Tax=Discostella pseudostelligera TaxID=259834 RepID=A0ABD3M7C5_9STRA
MDDQNSTQSISVAIASFIGTIIMGRLITRRDNTASSSSSSYAKETPTSFLPTPTQALTLVQCRRSIFPKQYSGKSIPRSIVNDMIEAARWAPSHKLTESWRFVVFESLDAKMEVANLLTELYVSSQKLKGKPIVQAKIDKKPKSAKLSSHIIAICVADKGSNPFVEEISSVSMAVQNMHLMATAHGVGAYWSSGGVHGPNSPSKTCVIENPIELTQFLVQHLPNKDETIVCLGWMYIGDYYGDAEEGSGPENNDRTTKKWPSGRRSPIEERVAWV